GTGQRRQFLVQGVNFRYVMKQMVAMVLSVNAATMANSHPDLQRFVLDPQHRTLVPFRVLLFHVPNHLGAGTITGVHGRADVIDQSNEWQFLGGEISGFPVGIVYTMNMGAAFARMGM